MHLRIVLAVQTNATFCRLSSALYLPKSYRIAEVGRDHWRLCS